MRRRVMRVALIVVGGLLLVVGIEAGTRAWVIPLKSAAAAGRIPTVAALSVRSSAEIAGPANGLYCGSPVENGVAVHDLGGFPAGVQVTVTVQPFTDEFHPAAAVLVATLGEKAANNVQVTTFYDDDRGDSSDVRVEFVTPRTGTYLLLVNDFADTIVGCYRYQVAVQPVS
jgi:hypothetical protein